MGDKSSVLPHKQKYELVTTTPGRWSNNARDYCHTKEYARIMAIASRGEFKMIFLWFKGNRTMLEIKIEYYDFRALNLKVSAKS